MSELNQQTLLRQDSPIQDKIQSKNICSVTQNRIIIQYCNSVFQVKRDVTQINDIKFKKIDDNNKLEEEIQASESFQFDCMYGMLQLQNTPVFIFVLESRQVGNINKNAIYQASKFRVIQVKNIQKQPFILSLQLSFQLFKSYYCLQYDLSKRMQLQFSGFSDSQLQYFSNFIHTLNFESFPSELLTVFINGYVKTQNIKLNDKKLRITLISRGNYHRLGRRWLRRGLDGSGNAANQYETELVLQIISVQRHQIYSHVQQRGSIPFFWEQIPCFDMKASINICPNNQKNQKSMNQYLARLKNKYKSVTLLNLINKQGRQGDIGNKFQEYFHNINHPKTKFIWFDYTQQYSKKKNIAFEQLINQLKEDLKGNYFYIVTAENDFEVKTQQRSVIRTNCMDCLDRTNFIQFLICKVICIQLQSRILEIQKEIVLPYNLQLKQLQVKLISLWKENGIAISKQYSGTSTMRTQFLEKGRRTFGGMLSDLFIGLHRFYLGHFSDYYYQNCIDLHFGRINLVEDAPQFKGVWWKRLFTWIAFSGIFVFPLLLKDKVAQRFKQKVVQYAIMAGTSFSGLLFGFIISKIARKAIIQQPISRKYEIIDL